MQRATKNANSSIEDRSNYVNKKRILTLISECNRELVNLFSGNKTHSEDSQGSSENLVKAAWPFLVFFPPSLPNINNSVKFYLK